MTDKAQGICSASSCRVIKSVTITHLHQFLDIDIERTGNAPGCSRGYLMS